MKKQMVIIIRIFNNKKYCTKIILYDKILVCTTFLVEGENENGKRNLCSCL